MEENRLRIIIGHYGSGKTEFAVNYAFYLKEQGHNVAIADLDIVNPYFRSREKKVELEEKGIKVVESSINNNHMADVPALSAEILTLLQTEKYQSILDVGGDAVGARVLGRFNRNIKNVNYDMWMVVNANRPNTQTVEQVIDYINDIEASSRLKINGLINNTHMLRDTSPEDVLRGDKLVKEVSLIKNIPVIYTSVISSVASQVENIVQGKVFPIDLYMRPIWL